LKQSRYMDDRHIGEFKKVWGQLSADKRLLVAETVNSIFGMGDREPDDIEAASLFIESIASDRRIKLTQSLARWIAEPAL